MIGPSLSGSTQVPWDMEIADAPQINVDSLEEMNLYKLGCLDRGLLLLADKTPALVESDRYLQDLLCLLLDSG